MVESPAPLTPKLQTLRSPRSPSNVRKTSTTSFTFFILFCMLVISRALDRVFFKRLANQMGSNYLLILSSWITPFVDMLVAFLIMVGYIIHKRLSGDYRYNLWFLSPWSELATTSNDRRRPSMWVYVVIAGSLQLKCVLQAPGTFSLSPTMMMLITQLDKPFTMIISKVWVGAKYCCRHYTGAGIFILAFFVSVAPKLISSSYCSEEQKLSKEGCVSFTSYKGVDGWEKLSFSAAVCFYSMFVASIVVCSSRTVFQMKKTKGFDIDPVFCYWLMSIFQVLFGFLFYPFLWAPWPGIQRLSPEHTLPDIISTIDCLGGFNTTDKDLCEGENVAPIVWFLLSTIGCCTFNLLFIWLVKSTTAMYGNLANSLCMLVSVFLSQFEFVQGPVWQSLRITDWVAVVIAGLGFYIYNSAPEVDEHGRHLHQSDLKFDDPAARKQEIIEDESDLEGRPLLSQRDNYDFLRYGKSAFGGA